MDRMKNFGFLLKDVSRRYSLRFEQHARDISMTLMQCKTLVYLEKNQGISQAKLAELTGMDAMMMVRIVDRMEADQLLERRPDPADRRARQLYLTKKAKPFLDKIAQLAEATRAEVFAGIGKTEREAFMHTLEQLHANVSALEGQPVEGAKPTKPTKKSRTTRSAAIAK